MPSRLTKEQIEPILERSKQLRDERKMWDVMYQLIGEYVHTRKMNFTETNEPGAFLNRYIFDSTAPNSAKIAASAILSMLWPKSKSRISLVPGEKLSDSKQNKEYFEWVTKQMFLVMDNPKSGLETALGEYMLDQITFATSGVEAYPDEQTKVGYRAWGVQHMCVDEGRNGFVDTVYIHLEWTVNRVVKEYGIENVSDKVKTKYESERGKSDKIKVTIAIEPRPENEKTKEGVFSMPWREVHIDNDNKYAMKETGHAEMPIKVTRFTKLSNEKYGRGLSQDALPDTLEINAVKEGVTIAIEKTLDPPLGVLDDGSLGGEEIDTSPRAINVFTVTGRIESNTNPVFPLFTVGDIKFAFDLLNDTRDGIKNAFLIDRLLDFNNETEMTLGEARLRDRIRNSTLSMPLLRQIIELFSPLVERTFNLLLEGGHLGAMPNTPESQDAVMVIPEEVAALMLAGEEVYTITYDTPAMRVMKNEELEGIIRSYEIGQLVSTTAQSVDPLDNFDHDVAMRGVRELTGAPSTMEKAKSDVKQTREARAQAMEQQNMLNSLQQGSEAIRNIGQSNVQLPGVKREAG